MKKIIVILVGFVLIFNGLCYAESTNYKKSKDTLQPKEKQGGSLTLSEEDKFIADFFSKNVIGFKAGSRRIDAYNYIPYFRLLFDRHNGEDFKDFMDDKNSPKKDFIDFVFFQTYKTTPGILQLKPVLRGLIEYEKIRDLDEYKRTEEIKKLERRIKELEGGGKRNE